MPTYKIIMNPKFIFYSQLILYILVLRKSGIKESRSLSKHYTSKSIIAEYCEQLRKKKVAIILLTFS